MRAETQSAIAEVEGSLVLLRQRVGWETAQHRLEEFNALSEDPTLWNNPEKAQKLMRERQALVDSVDVCKSIAQDLSDQVELIEMGEAEGDADVIAEAEAALNALREKAAQKEIEALLDGEADGNDTFLEVNAGAGGVEEDDAADGAVGASSPGAGGDAHTDGGADAAEGTSHGTDTSTT